MEPTLVNVETILLTSEPQDAWMLQTIASCWVFLAECICLH